MEASTLFSSVLPCGKHKYFTKALERNIQNNQLNEYHQSYLMLAEMILKVCQETAQAIHQARFKEFDALVKNFACQITALEVYQLVKQKEMLQEARRINQLIPERIEKIGKLLNANHQGLKGNNCVDYFRKLDLDLDLSPAMAHLVRFRLLNIINSNRVVNNKEIPATDLNRLESRVQRIMAERKTSENESELNRSYLLIPFKNWIENMQMEESNQAVDYIRGEAQSLHADGRALQLRRLLDAEFVKLSKATPKIASTPQLTTCEVVLKRYEGIILVKNKLMIGDVPRADATPKKAYIQMPENIILNDDQTQSLDPNLPIMVIEAYIASEFSVEDLKGLLKTHGVINFVNATAAELNQYISNTPKNDPYDSIIEQDLEKFKTNEYRQIYEKAEVEHIYTSSIGVER